MILASWGSPGDVLEVYWAILEASTSILEHLGGLLGATLGYMEPS